MPTKAPAKQATAKAPTQAKTTKTAATNGKVTKAAKATKRAAPVEPPDTFDFLTVDEAAVLARRTPEAMRQLRKRNKGPKFIDVDGKLLIERTALYAWMRGE